MSDFEAQAARGPRGGLLSDSWHLVRRTKKWWLVPLMLFLLILGGLWLLAGTPAAPFIYTLF